MIFCPHNPKNLHEKGFTLPELLISISILAIIFAFSGINLLRIIPKSSLTEISGSFIADVKSQQYAAMLGESNSSSQFDYSIKVDDTSYTLFRGSVFDPNDPLNYTVNYPDNVSASTGMPNPPGDILTFSAITGDIKNYDSNHSDYYRVTFEGLYDNRVVIRFNKLGNVYYVN